MLCALYLNLKNYKNKKGLFNKVPFFLSTKDDIKNQIITCTLSHNFSHKISGEILPQIWRLSHLCKG